MGNKHIQTSCSQLNFNFIPMQMIYGEAGTTEMQRLQTLIVAS